MQRTYAINVHRPGAAVKLHACLQGCVKTGTLRLATPMQPPTPSDTHLVIHLEGDVAPLVTFERLLDSDPLWSYRVIQPV